MVHAEPLCFLKDQAEDAVVRADEIIAFRYDDDRASAAADAGIDNGKMDRALGKVAVGGFEGEGGFPDVLRSDLMGDVDDLGLRIDLEDHAFHASGE